jgi:hypothetical protein
VSQVATKRKLAIRNERVKITAHFHEHGSVLAGTFEGLCDGFEIAISLDSDEPAAAIAELLRIAHKACFTEHALTHPVSLSKVDLLNGKPLEY